MNSDVWEITTLDKYLHTLSLLESILIDFNFDAVYFIGDFNADPSHGRAWRNLTDFNNRNNLTCYDVNELCNDSYTFIGYGNSQSRWLDHIVGRGEECASIRDINILVDFIGSDHLPLELIVSIRNKHVNNAFINENRSGNSEFLVDWNKLKINDFNHISNFVNVHLLGLNDHQLFNCTTVGCHIKEHLGWIDELYHNIVNAVHDSTEKYRKRSVKVNKHKVIPGWNREVKQFHSVARDHYLTWVAAGKLIGTLQHTLMLNSRKEFKKALSECQRNENKEICKSIIEKFACKDKRSFWKEVKRKKEKTKDTNLIDGQHEKNKITDIFTQNFLGTGQESSIDSELSEYYFIEEFKRKWSLNRKMFLKVSSVSLRRMIGQLNSGVGPDGIHSLF